MMKLKVNNVPGFSGVVNVATDQDGAPLEKFWRRRLKDAESDNCVEVVIEKARKKQSKQEQAE